MSSPSSPKLVADTVEVSLRDDETTAADVVDDMSNFDSEEDDINGLDSAWIKLRRVLVIGAVVVVNAITTAWLLLVVVKVETTTRRTLAAVNMVPILRRRCLQLVELSLLLGVKVNVIFVCAWRMNYKLSTVL